MGEKLGRTPSLESFMSCKEMGEKLGRTPSLESFMSCKEMGEKLGRAPSLEVISLVVATTSHKIVVA
jgi:hypothetical protein